MFAVNGFLQLSNIIKTMVLFPAIESARCGYSVHLLLQSLDLLSGKRVSRLLIDLFFALPSAIVVSRQRFIQPNIIVYFGDV